MYSPYVFYTSHMSQLLTYFCQSTLSSSLRDVVNCRTLSLGSKKLRTSNITKLRTCGCRLQELQSCGLRLRTSRIRKLRTCGCRFKNPEKSLRTKLLNVHLRTCGCGLRKLKFGCGFADLKKNLRCPALQLLPYCFEASNHV